MTTVERSLRALMYDGARTGAMGPGTKLPPERALVELMAAPRSEIRRALASLAAEGLVTRHVGRGTFVTDEVAAAAASAAGTSPDNTSPAEIMQARTLIEPPLAALAARAATQADLKHIADCLDQGGKSASYVDFERWDGKFHRGLALAAHNGLLLAMFDVVGTARALPVWGSLKRRTSTPERRRSYHEQHSAIVEALRDRDPDMARTAMRDHLRRVTDDLLGGN